MLAMREDLVLAFLLPWSVAWPITDFALPMHATAIEVASSSYVQSPLAAETAR